MERVDYVASTHKPKEFGSTLNRRYDLLRYVGHESTLDEVKEMLDQVDYNHNGTMDRRGPQFGTFSS